MSSISGVVQGRVQCPSDLSEANYNLQKAFPDFAETLGRWRSSSREVLQKLMPSVDIPYGDKPLQNLDFYRAAAVNTPLLVFVHGGYWQGGDKNDVGFIAAPYVQAGISVAVINYSLAPAARVEDMVAEVRQAIAWLRQNAEHLSVNTSRISLMGHSAGGHLVASMIAQDEEGTRYPHLANVFPISGLFDLPPLLPSYVNNALSLNLARAEALSPITGPGPRATRVYTIIGELETTQLHLQSFALAQRWKQVLAHYVVPATDHFTVLEALGDPASVYAQAVIQAINAQ